MIHIEVLKPQLFSRGKNERAALGRGVIVRLHASEMLLTV